MPDLNASPRVTRPTGRRTRLVALVASATLAAMLATLPGGPGPGPVGAARPHPLATHASTMVSVGRVSVRALAQREAVGRSAKVPGPPRLGWPRAGRRASEGAAPGAIGGAALGVTTTPATSADATTAGWTATSGGSGGGTAGTATARWTATASEPMATTALATAAAGGPGVVGTAWNGMTDQAVDCGSSRPCAEPADPWIAVSATHVVQSVNQATRITDRAGGNASLVSNSAFFGVGAWNAGAFATDPRVLYDPARGRWVATLFAGTCSGGALFVAVSETGDPNATWQRFFTPFVGHWPDFPTLGYSSTLVAVGFNEFVAPCPANPAEVAGTYVGARLQVMDWADLVDGGDAPKTATTSPDVSRFTYSPAAGLSSGSTLHAVVALDDGTGATADLGYVSVSGTVAGGDLAIAPPIALVGLAGGKLKDPPTPVDAGGLIGLQRNAIDLRPTDAVWLKGRLAVATTTACVVGTASRPCGRVIELLTRADLSAPAVRQDLRIAPTAGNTDTFMPGVGYSSDGTLWTVFSQSGAGRFVSSWARRQVAAAGPGAWSPGAALVAAGRGPYGGTAGAGLNERWGDYVGVARDPAQPGSVWQANQLADTGGGWATRVARLGDDVTPPTLVAPRPSFVSGSKAGRTSIPIRVAFGATDPGSGIASVRLERSVNGGAYAPVAIPSSATRTATQSLSYGARYRYRIAATDNAGNVSTAPLEGPSFVPTIYSERSSRVGYRGTWTTARNASYLGGGVRYASVARRRATITLTGLAVAWVATMSRTRGRARVYADGVLQGSYSTYRSTASYRRVITSRTFAAAGTHTYRVEVVGTAGHPRVDLDAFIVLR